MNKFFDFDWAVSAYHGDPNNFQTVYVTVWKCANEQIRSMEKELFKDKQRFNGTYTEDGEGEVMSLYNALEKVGLIDFVRHKKNRNIIVRFNAPPPPPPLPPCIYTAIRDPISHFLSGYNEVEYRMLVEYANDTTEKKHHAPYHYVVPYTHIDDSVRNDNNNGINFDSSDGDDENSKKALLRDHLHGRRKERFEAFVKDFLRQEATLASNLEYEHVFSMTRILTSLAKFNQTLTGYVPTIENITSKWPAFISKTCPGAPPLHKMPKMQIQGQHKSSKDPLGLYEAAKDVWKEGGPISRALCLLHAFDYACWKDLPAGIPDLCMEVYHKHAARILKTTK